MNFLASGNTSFRVSHRGFLPRQTITAAISSGLLNLCHCLHVTGDACGGFEQIKSDDGSALNTQYDLPKGSFPIGTDFPQAKAASLVILVL